MNKLKVYVMGFGMLALGLMVPVALQGGESGHDHSKKSKPAATEKVEVKPDEITGKPGEYPLKNCVVAGGALGSMGDPYKFTHEGTEVQFCCEGCMPGFRKDPAKHIAKIHAAVVAREKENYPLKKCVVSLEDLDAHGGAVEVVHNNRLFILCCKGCVDELKENSTVFEKLLDEAGKKQS